MGREICKSIHTDSAILTTPTIIFFPVLAKSPLNYSITIAQSPNY